MKNWSEVTAPMEIARLTRQLKDRLRESTNPGGKFRIGYPVGSFEASVRLAPGRNHQKLWTYSGRDERTGDFFTLVGRCVPDQRGPLLIDLQFNFPIGRFSRQKGGAFVKDHNGRVFLAHRGIVTKGTARIDKTGLFRRLNWHSRVIANSDVKPYKVELLLVAPLDDNRLVGKIQRFASTMRDAATLAAVQERPAKRAGKKPDTSRPSETRLDLILSAYREEFAGTRVIKRTKPVVMKWTHGKIVHALRRALSDRGESLKCKATDLVLLHRSNIDLFEVKSSAASQSIYTAIGQLIFNGRVLERTFPSHSVYKFLVLPSSVKHRARQELCKELGFNLVTFKPRGTGFTFIGLPE
ncbi:Uncharacterised protein [Burkholderia pseudomallei]|nr:Uncharacterised protein [Burkholderia pseudomallei]